MPRAGPSWLWCGLLALWVHPAPLAAASVQAVQQVGLGSGDGVGWSVSNANSGSIAGVAALPAAVPGCVHTDLLAGGAIGEPNFGNNSLAQRWVASANFTYTTKPFAVPAALLDRRNVELVLKGIDTAAKVRLNGHHVLVAKNMHRTFLVDAKRLLRGSGNTLVLAFTGPVPASLAAEATCAAAHGGLCGDAACVCPTPWLGPPNGKMLAINGYIRKEQQSFAWDFAPATGTTGIGVSPRIVGYDAALLRDTVVDTRPTGPRTGTGPRNVVDSSWAVSVSVRMWSTLGPAPSGSNATVTASFEGLGVRASVAVVVGTGETVSTLTITVPASAKVEAWWPNGYGGQALYPLTVTLTTTASIGGGHERQNKTVMVGFRTVAIEQPALSPGNGDGHLYQYVVNGVRIYARGSNWVPSQSLQPRVNPRQVRRHFEAYRTAHFTNLRVWGGGVYVDDDLMSLADEFGIIILHDFMFGDQFYPTDVGTLTDVAAEVRDQAWRLGSHASLGVWCGNNEIAFSYQIAKGPYSRNHDFFAAAPFYSALFFDTILGNLSAVDPARAATWISSTPSQGNETAAVPYNRNGSTVELRGDMHYYDMQDDWSINCWDVAEIAPRARFVTETGWISWPSFITMAPTLDPTDYGFNGSVAGSRVEHPSAQRECTHQVNLNWRWPDRHPSTSAAGYRDELWMTQVAASQCLVASIEFWRSTESELVNTSYPLSPLGWAMLGDNAGVMYWQADDTWPGPSWSTIELGGRLKVGHYAVARSFAPLMVTGRVGSDGRLAVYFSRSGSGSSHSALPDAAEGTAVLRITAFKWSGGSGSVDFPVSLPAAHSTAKLLSRDIEEVLGSINCSSGVGNEPTAAARCCTTRAECVLGIEVVTQAATAEARGLVNGQHQQASGDQLGHDHAESTLASNTVYLSPLHQVTTMVADPGLVVRDVVPAGGASPGLSVFNVTVTAVRTPAALVWLETPLSGRWSDNAVLLTTPELKLQWTTDEDVTAHQLAASVSVRSLVDVAASYSSGARAVTSV